MRIERSFNLPFIFLKWYFFYVPQEILKRIRNLVRFGVYFFSVSLILKTFFSPWKRLQDSYRVSIFDFRRYFEKILGNLISRVIGMILRFCLLIAFVFFEILVFFLGLVILISWILAPLASLIFIWYAFSTF